MQKITLSLLISVAAMSLFLFSASSRADELNMNDGSSDSYIVNSTLCLENPELPECINDGNIYPGYGYGGYGYDGYGYGGYYGRGGFGRHHGGGHHGGHHGGHQGHSGHRR